MEDSLDRDVAELWSLLFAIVTDGEKRLAGHFEAHQLTPPQFYVLKTLSENQGECRIGDIARDHHLTNATMTGLVKRLEAMDPPLVRRRRNTSDGRSVDVLLTEAWLSTLCGCATWFDAAIARGICSASRWRTSGYPRQSSAIFCCILSAVSRGKPLVLRH